MNFKGIIKSIMDNENLKSKLESLQSFEDVYKFFLDNGYEGTKQELSKNLFGRSETTHTVPEAELDQVVGGANGRQALAACAGLMMMLGVAPVGIDSQSSAKTASFDNALSLTKIGEKNTKKQDTKGYDADKAKERLNYTFENYFHGQSGVKDLIMTFLEQYTQDKKTGLPAPNLLIFNGPSGIGKTFMAKLLSAAITPIDPYVITGSDILKASNSEPTIAPHALFYGAHGITKKYSDRDNLMSFLKATEGSVRVVIVDDWDRLYVKDTNENYPETHPLGETLRDILNNRLTDYTGAPVDLNGVVFIFTGNASTASIQGRIQVDPKTDKLVEAVVDENGYPVFDENGNQVYGEPKTNGQGQTLVPHDRSLMGHLSGSICYFDDNKE